MKRLLIALALLSLATAACGKDKDDKTAAATTTLAATTTTVPATTTTFKKATTTTTAKKATTTTQTDTRVPADSATPAAGACGEPAGGYGDVTLNPDIPSPRCVVVHDTDHLRVKNNMGVGVFVDDGAGGFSLNQGETYSPMKAVGGYWQPGVHRLKITNKNTHAVLYGGSGPEIWFKD